VTGLRTLLITSTGASTTGDDSRPSGRLRVVQGRGVRLPARGQPV